MRSLSKSKIIAYRQCPKRLWLEIHRPELRDDSASEMVFRIGNQVGDVARSIYDPEGRGVFLDIQEIGHEKAFARSAVLLQSGEVPVFEAGMVAGGALAYADGRLTKASHASLPILASSGVRAIEPIRHSKGSFSSLIRDTRRRRSRRVLSAHLAARNRYSVIVAGMVPTRVIYLGVFLLWLLQAQRTLARRDAQVEPMPVRRWGLGGRVRRGRLWRGWRV